MLPWLHGWCGTLPSPIADALGEGMIAHQVGDPQVFQIDHIVLAHQRERGLVVKVRALAPHMLVLLRALGHGLLPALQETGQKAPGLYYSNRS